MIDIEKVNGFDNGLTHKDWSLAVWMLHFTYMYFLYSYEVKFYCVFIFNCLGLRYENGFMDHTRSLLKARMIMFISFKKYFKKDICLQRFF